MKKLFFFVALFFLFSQAFAVETGDYRRFSYGNDFNLSNWVVDINGQLDTDFSSSCILNGKNDLSNLQVFSNTAMLNDPVLSGLYYAQVGASNKVAWPKGKYSIVMQCTDYGVSGSENVSFVIGDDVSQLIQDANSYLGGLIIDTNAVGHGLSADQNAALYEIRNLASDINHAVGLLPQTVWAYASRTLTDYNQARLWVYLSDINAVVNDINGETWITAQQVWEYGNRSLTDYNQQSMFSYLADINAAVKDINGRPFVSAADVWNYASRSLTDYNQQAILDYQASLWGFLEDINAVVVDTNSNVWVSAQDIWAYSVRSLTDYNQAAMFSYLAGINAFVKDINGNSFVSAQDIWNYSVRSLTDYNQATMFAFLDDINAFTFDTNATTSNIWLNQTRDFKAILSDFGSIANGSVYRAKLWIFDFNGSPKDADSTPKMTLYDSARNIIAQNIDLNRESTGIYSYSFVTNSGHTAGQWEAVASATVNGATVMPSDYWELTGNPPEVKINAITDTTVPTIVADVSIKNEGIGNQEYQYEYCIVSDQNNQCNNGDDVDYQSGAKLINAGQTWNTNLTLNVPSSGTYWFKIKVYYGAERSAASKQFTATAEAVPPVTAGGGTTGMAGAGGGKGKLAIDYYPDEIILAPAEPSFFEVRVTNIGNAALTKLAISIGNVPSGWYYIEQDKNFLKPGDSASFLLAITAPEGTQAKDFVAKITVSAEQDSVSKDTIVRVLETAGPPLKEIIVTRIENRKVYLNGQGKTTISLKNQAANDMNLVVSLLVPVDWQIPENASKITIKAGEEKELEFYYTVSERVGMRSLVISIKKSDGTKFSSNGQDRLLKEFLIIVLGTEIAYEEPAAIPFGLLFAALLVLIVLVLAALLKRKAAWHFSRIEKKLDAVDKKVTIIENWTKTKKRRWANK